MKVLREVVNGALLSHTIGNKVSVIGKVSNVDSNGMSFEMNTTDNQTVIAKLSSPVDDILEGYVEVHGTCQSKNVILADEYIQFSAQQTENFDTEGHNKLCALLQQIPEPYKIG